MRRKAMIVLSILIITFTLILLPDYGGEEYTIKAYEGSYHDLMEAYTTSYTNYLENKEQVYPEEEVILNGTNYSDYENNFNQEYVYNIDRDGITGLYVPETVNVSWNFYVEEAGYYNINIMYYTIEDRSADISKGLKINGEYPFSEAENFILSRVWEDKYDVALERQEGKHDLKPEQIEKNQWLYGDIRDTKGYYQGRPYFFYFEEGENTLTLEYDKEPVIISEIKLYQAPVEKTYAEVEEEYISQGYQHIDLFNNSESEFLKIQGENTFEKSSPILGPVANWSSYKVDPYEKFMLRYNTVGGQTWRVSGDWIKWEMDVPVSGLYQITLKVNQSYKQGMVSNRLLRVNGEVPFEEARNIQFSYDNDWQNVTLGDGEEAYWFYLEEGKNYISLEATIGVYHDIVRNTEATIQVLNNMYRQIVMVTGANPDEYQDYMLYKRIDGLSEMISESISKLESSVSEIVRISGNRSSLISAFEKQIMQLKNFQKSEKSIQIGLNELDDNIAALGAWIMKISEQPLAIDCIYLHSEDAELPKADTNFFQKIWHEIVMLFGSYGANTSLESNVEVDGPTITVWIMSGRDQSQLLRQIIDEQFTVQKNINVELKLVSQTALLPATLSGNGPDVAIGVPQNIPVNWGIRNAVIDLTQFSDFEEIQTRFHQSAVTPFEFAGSTYALPDTQDFLVTFVRDDIVNELDIDVPQTWDEVVSLLPGLQRQHLDYYILNSKGTLSTIMHSMIVQNGGSLYSENGDEVLLLERNAMDAFIKYTTFFSDFGFEKSANFANRFRSGEMPIGITNFTLYNTLSVFAPEIRGNWSFAEMPGYEVDGEIYNQSTQTSTGTIILEDTEEKEASWEFMKWWLSADAQTSYGRGVEAILGAAARYPTANLEAFANLPWSAQEFAVLNAQRSKTVGVPTVPGDYIIGRYIDNAFRATINDGTNPRDNLFEYVTKINLELERKRKEFGLD